MTEEERRKKREAEKRARQRKKRKRKQKKEKEKQAGEGKFSRFLTKNHISYFSDLFVMAMVVLWILVVLIMVGTAIYATVVIADTSIWCYVQELVAVPLTAGGAIWMVKCAVQHAMASSKGEECKADFPKVPVDEELELEQRMGEEIEGG